MRLGTRPLGLSMAFLLAALPGPGAPAQAINPGTKKIDEGIQRLIDQLKNPRESVRSRQDAAWMLGQIGGAAVDAIPALTAALDEDKDPEVRRAAVVAVRQIGPGPEHRAQLMRMLKDDENWKEKPAWQLPRAIVDSLVQFDPRPKEEELGAEIVRLLREGDADARKSAADALREIGAGAKQATDLIAHLDRRGDRSPEGDRALASVIYALRVIAPTEDVATKAIPKLKALLVSEQSHEVLRSVADALTQYAFHPDEDTALCLKPLLRHPVPEVRLSAADAMARLGDKARVAIEDLVALSKRRDAEPGRRDPGAGPRRSAVTALGRIVRSEEGKLIEHALRDGDWQVRLAAVDAMQHLLPADPLIVDGIALRLHDPSWEVRRSAAETLERLGDRAWGAVFPLVSVLDDIAPQVREAGAIALGEIKPHAVAVIAETNKTLARHGGEGKGATPGEGEAAGDEIYQSLLRDLRAKGLGTDGFRLAAGPDDGNAEAAGRRGPEGAGNKEREHARRKIVEVLVDEMLKALSQPYPLVKEGAQDALRAMGPLAVPHLIDVLGRGGTAEVRASIIRAVGGMRINPADESGVEIALPRLAEIACGAEGDQVTEAARASVVQIADDLVDYTPADPGRLDRAARKAEEAQRLAEHPAYHPSDVTKNVRSRMGSLAVFLRGKIEPNWLRHAAEELYGATTEFVGNLAKYSYMFIISAIVILLPLLWAVWLCDPLRRIRHSEWLRTNVPFGIKVPGLDVRIGDFVRAISLVWLGDRSDSALDAWADQYAGRVEGVFEGWQVGTTAGPRVDEERLAHEFDKEKTCLLIEARDAPGQRASIRQVALWALSRGRGARGARRMIPVLVDVPEADDVKGRRGFIELVRGQLQALTEAADAPSAELVEILLKRRRILVMISCCGGMVAAIKHLVDQADFPANALAIVARPDGDQPSAPDDGTALPMKNFHHEIALSVT